MVQPLLQANDRLTLLHMEGSGRVCAIVYDSPQYEELAGALFHALKTRNRVMLVQSPYIDHSNWAQLSLQLHELLMKQGVRQVSLLAFGAAATVAENLALRELRLVRTLLLVDGTIRPHPSFLEEFADRVEAWLPLGLPLRMRAPGFNAKPYLQRIRCPVVVVTSCRAQSFHIVQARTMVDELPTAWYMHLERLREQERLQDLVLQLQEIPARCPQKG